MKQELCGVATDTRSKAVFCFFISVTNAAGVGWKRLPESLKLLCRGLAGQGQTRHANKLREEKTMAVYVIADIKVTDDKWVPEYAAKVHDIVHRHGGKYLSRSANVTTLEGQPLETTLIAILAFPTPQAVEAFATDPDYAPFASARQAGSQSRFQMIDDTDVAGTIPYLQKG